MVKKEGKEYNRYLQHKFSQKIMSNFSDLESFFDKTKYKLILAADAEPFVHKKIKKDVGIEIPAGGVATTFDPIARATHAIFVARGKTTEDKEVSDRKGIVSDPTNSYTLKRLFFSEEELQKYYYGFANQTLWPLCHVAFQQPKFSWTWYEGFKKVNERFAKAIKEQIKGKTFIWLNDYQLSLVPSYLGKNKDTVIGFFWHIPWPTWEVFRILPQKKQILESLLLCDFIAFHRGYQARNFLRCVERELEARIDAETHEIFYNKHTTTVTNLPMGIDTTAIDNLVSEKPLSFLGKLFGKKRDTIGEEFFAKEKVLIGVDRLDYTKGLPQRLEAIDNFFATYPAYIGKVTYLSVLALSRQEISAYASLKKEVIDLVHTINTKYARRGWEPIHLMMQTYPREEIVELYKRAAVCLVTPLDDGMNLVSKEFVTAASLSKTPGMLVLSQFAGSAIDLTRALIVNPYDTKEVARAIKQALDMSDKEKKTRIDSMRGKLDDRNLYDWALDFFKQTLAAAR